MRYRIIKKYGNTFVITLTRSDVKDFCLKEGDEVNIEDMIKNKKKKGAKSKWNLKFQMEWLK